MSNSHQNIFENWRGYVSDILSETKRTDALKDLLKRATRISGKKVVDPKVARQIVLDDRMKKIAARRAKEKAAKAAAGDATQATPPPDVDTPPTVGDTQVVNTIDPGKTKPMGSADPKTGKTQPMGSKTDADATVQTNRPVPDPDATTVSVEIPDEINAAANKIESPNFIDKEKLPEILNDLINGADPQRVASNPELLDIYKQLLRDQSELKRLAKQGVDPARVGVARVKMARRIRNIASQLDAGDVAEAQRVQALLDINSYGALNPNHATNKIISDGGYAVRYIQANKGKVISSIAVLALAAAYINTGDDGIPDTLAAQDPNALQKLKDTLSGIEDVDMEGGAEGPEMSFEPEEVYGDETEGTLEKSQRISQDSGKDIDEVTVDLEERKIDALADALIPGNMRFKISDFPTRMLRLFVSSIVQELERYFTSRNANIRTSGDGKSLDLRITDPKQRKQAILDYLGIDQENLKTMKLRGTALSLQENKNKFDPSGDARALYVDSILTFMENISDGGFGVDPRWQRFSDTDGKLGKTMSEKEKTYFKRKFYNALRLYLGRAYERLTSNETMYKRMVALKKKGKLNRLKYLEKYDEE